ncbi:sugar porter family MFS transporter [Arthrobacter crystallopoietes]|uniref:MFS transporter, sugar porter (SP) family n=1 Tax=Crystallibacter crystallopoietes TaxID=37928 RepID=A0A1H1AVV1_9MICC|nr:sugar porter family MFS transporter [Arthrobacter crystallopoietes]SDQ43774.1 MFS transporter, sugar porter (SP) family [Arthrobacter crystallopoietes]
MQKPLVHEKTPLKVVMVAIVAALGGFLFGFDSAVINGAVDAVQQQFGLGSVLLGFTVSCALLGAMIGAWLSGPLADRQGRVRAMLVASVLFTLSAVGSGLAFGVTDLIIWRFIGGIGVGMASVLAPAYIAEVSPAHSRGRLGSLQQLAIVLGIFVALLTDAFLAAVAGGAGEPMWFGLEAWRWMFLAETVPAVLYGLLALQVPESPRYLVAKDELVGAAKVLRDVVGLNGKQAVQDKIQAIRETIHSEERQGLKDLMGGKGWLLPIVWIGIFLSVFQQFVGINVIFYYSTSLWRSVGFNESDSFSITVITSVTNIVVTVVAIMLVDKVGRKPLLVAGSIGMLLSLGVMALCFSQAIGTGEDVTLPQPWGVVALIAANLFVVSFGATWGPVVWVLLGEMFPNRIRAVALSVAAAAQWLANFAITTTFPFLADIDLTLAYGLYAFFALLSLVFVWKFVPETKGKELEAM